MKSILLIIVLVLSIYLITMKTTENLRSDLRSQILQTSQKKHHPLSRIQSSQKKTPLFV
jgi:hypothetical protein